MKSLNKYPIIASLELLLGAGGAVLLRQILNDQLDQRGLILPGTASQLILWVLTAAAALLALIPSLKGSLKPSGKVSGIACIIMGAGILTILKTAVTGPAILLLIHQIMLYASAACLFIVGILRLIGREGELASVWETPAGHMAWCVLYGAPTVFTLLQLVVCYQRWSERPQLYAYIFGVGAVLFIMLAAYGLLEHAAGMKSRRFTLYAVTIGIFFTAVAVGQGEFSLFFAASSLWMLLQPTGLAEAGEN